MRLKKLRPSELLELLGLLAGCALLFYFSCRGRDTASGATPRESRTFSAERTAPESPGDTADAAARQRAVESAIGELIERVALGQVDEAQRSEAQLSLVALLERWGWGTPENRTSGAAVIVQQIFDRANRKPFLLTRAGVQLEFVSIHASGLVIWGLTERVLSQLSEVLDKLG